jgi:hypothetical protein
VVLASRGCWLGSARPHPWIGGWPSPSGCLSRGGCRATKGDVRRAGIPSRSNLPRSWLDAWGGGSDEMPPLEAALSPSSSPEMTESGVNVAAINGVQLGTRLALTATLS